MGNKRIYLDKENSKYAQIAGGAIITISALFFVLMAMGFEITGSDDICLGTADDPCVSYGKICNLGPDNYDIYNPSEFNMDFSPTVKNYWIFFKDGRVKKEFLYDQGVNHSTNGWRFENFTDATKPRKDRVYVHRFAAYKCQEYMLVGLKENSDDVIKWGVGVGKEYLDPFWYGVGTDPATSLTTSLDIEVGSQVNITTNISGASTVCVDIDHPDYGINYTCGTPNAEFLFNISYFRNDEFNDSTTQKNFSYEDFDDYSINAGGYEDPSYWETDHLYTLAHDGDLATYAMVSTSYPSMTYYVNYLIPPNINQSDVGWFYKDNNDTGTLVIPDHCIDVGGNDAINLSVLLHHGFFMTDPHIVYSCKNSTAWHVIKDTGDLADWGETKLYEELIVWDTEPLWPVYIRDYGFTVNKLDELFNLSINLTGATNNGSLPTNIRIKINGTTSNTIPILMEAEETLQNITDPDGGFVEEIYWANEGICDSGTWTTSNPCTNSYDQDFTTLGQMSTSAGDIYLNFTKPDSAANEVYTYSKTQGNEAHYCWNSTDWRYYDSYSEQNLLLFEDCYGSLVDKVQIKIHMTGTYSYHYETKMIVKYDGSNATFQLDGQSTRVASLKLPKDADVSQATFNVYGSESEPFNDVIIDAESDGSTLATSLQTVSQSFIPQNENLEAIWMFGAVGSDTMTVDVGTTVEGTEISTDTITFDGLSGLGGWVKWDITDSVLTPGTEYFITFSSSGDIIDWDYSSQNPYSGGMGYIDGVKNESNDYFMKTVSSSLAFDPKITIGPLDSDYEWNATGNYSGDSSSVDLAVNLTEYLTTCSAEDDGYCFLPFNMLASTPGKLRVHNVTITHFYDPNPIYLDMDILDDYLEGFSSGEINIPITMLTDSGGNVTVDDVRIDYLGGNDTIDVLVWESTDKSNNESMTLINYYSDMTVAYPPNLEWMEFIPRRPVQDNVSAYGQSDLVPILNFTSQAYGGKDLDLTVHLNESHSCVNLTISTTKNKEDGFALNDSWTEIYGDVAYGDSTPVWLWADYNCNYTTWKLWEPDLSFRPCCVDCICSEDLI